MTPTTNEPPDLRCVVSNDDGRGLIRIEDDFDTGIDDLWSALTEPDRLARWYGHVEGDLRQHGRFSVRVEPVDLDSIGTVETCEPPGRLVVTLRETDASATRGNGPAPFNQVVDATLTSLGQHRTHLALRLTGFPLNRLPAYGAGWQVNAERLVAHLGHTEAPGEPGRWASLVAAYSEQLDHR